MIDPDVRKRSLLVSLRKKAKFSQQDLADRLGVRRATISDWENGKASPEMPMSTYWRLIHLLGCTPEELIEAFEGEEALKAFLQNKSEEPSQTN